MCSWCCKDTPSASLRHPRLAAIDRLAPVKRVVGFNQNHDEIGEFASGDGTCKDTGTPESPAKLIEADKNQEPA